MRSARHIKGFTVIELLVGMLITSIILSAVATFAFAMSVASAASGDTAVKQAQIRQAMVRIRDLVATCKLLCAAPGNDLAIWRADDNSDGQINLNELVYIERGNSRNLLQLCQFSTADNPRVNLSDLALETTKSQLVSTYGATCVPLIPACRDVQLAFYPVPPPITRAQCLMISFLLTENGSEHPYEIVVALQCRAGYLLNAAGNALVASDDD